MVIDRMPEPMPIAPPVSSSTSSDSNCAILASASYDHTIRFWDVKTGSCAGIIQHADSQINALALTHDRKQIAAAGYQHIRLYDVGTKDSKPLTSCEAGALKNVTAVGFQREMRWMYTGSEDCSARIWDMRVRSAQCSRIFQVNGPVSSVCLHPNQHEIIVGDQNGTIYIWDLRNDHNEQLNPTGPGTLTHITHVEVDQYGQHLAACTNNGLVYMYDLKDHLQILGEQAMPIPKPASEQSSSQPSPQSTTDSPQLSPQIACRVNPREPMRNVHRRYVMKCRFSSDSSHFLTCGSDSLVKVWSLKNLDSPVQECEIDISKQKDGKDNSRDEAADKEGARKGVTKPWVWDARFAQSGALYVCSSTDMVVRQFKLVENADPAATLKFKAKKTQVYQGHSRAVVAMAFVDRST